MEPSASAAMSQHTSSSMPINATLLRKYGLSEVHQTDAVEALVRSACTYGNESLITGLQIMFKGMNAAVEIHAETTNEIYLLHEGILRMKQEVSDTKEQMASAEAMAQQHMQVAADPQSHPKEKDCSQSVSLTLDSSGAMPSRQLRTRHRHCRNRPFRINCSRERVRSGSSPYRKSTYYIKNTKAGRTARNHAHRDGKSSGGIHTTQHLAHVNQTAASRSL